MPRVIEPGQTRTASLAETIEALTGTGFDPGDEASLLHAAGWLQRLALDPRFLADYILAELAERHTDDPFESGYGPQVMMLSPPRGDFFIRANIWPSANETMLRASGGASFVYGLPHDHNFDFLTVGYFGPGYWSDYYEYDYGAVAGARGEPVPSMHFVERSRLEPGKVMHYRAHRDIHAQHPPDALSVSLNIMHTAPARTWHDQYSFDLTDRTVGRIVSSRSSEAFLRIAAALGGEEGLDLAHRFAASHPSDAMRLCALGALAARESDPRARDAVWARGEGSGSRLVATEARRRRMALGA